MKISFAQIDAKDNPVIGIVGHTYISKENLETMTKAESEYLEGLINLQNNIKNKYEKDLIEHEPLSYKDLDKEYYIERDKIVAKYYPHTFETYSLWYS